MSVEFTNRPKCEHTLEQSYSGMYSIFQQCQGTAFQIPDKNSGVENHTSEDND